MGQLPRELSDLAQLRELDLSGKSNVLYGWLPRLHFSALSACDLGHGYFTCPLPPGTKACHASPAAGPTCHAPWPRLSAACSASQGRLRRDRTLAALRGAFGNAVPSILAAEWPSQCEAPLASGSHTCSFKLNWTSTSQGRQLIDATEKAAAAVDPTARLCLLDVTLNKSACAPGKTACTLHVPQMLEMVYGDACGAADRKAMLDFVVSPPVCAGGFDAVKCSAEPDADYLSGCLAGK